MTLEQEVAFWIHVDWKESDVPAWEPKVVQQLLSEAANQYATDWALPNNEEVA